MAGYSQRLQNYCAGLLRRLDPEIIRAELGAQLTAFKESFGRTPDFVDGHQHVQLFPQIRDAFLAAVKETAPQAWGSPGGSHQPPAQRGRLAQGVLARI